MSALSVVPLLDLGWPDVRRSCQSDCISRLNYVESARLRYASVHNTIARLFDSYLVCPVSPWVSCRVRMTSRFPFSLNMLSTLSSLLSLSMPLHSIVYHCPPLSTYCTQNCPPLPTIRLRLFQHFQYSYALSSMEMLTLSFYISSSDATALSANMSSSTHSSCSNCQTRSRLHQVYKFSSIHFTTFRVIFSLLSTLPTRAWQGFLRSHRV